MRLILVFILTTMMTTLAAQAAEVKKYTGLLQTDIQGVGFEFSPFEIITETGIVSVRFDNLKSIQKKLLNKMSGEIIQVSGQEIVQDDKGETDPTEALKKINANEINLIVEHAELQGTLESRNGRMKLFTDEGKEYLLLASIYQQKLFINTYQNQKVVVKAALLDNGTEEPSDDKYFIYTIEKLQLGEE